MIVAVWCVFAHLGLETSDGLMLFGSVLNKPPPKDTMIPKGSRATDEYKGV
jgi:hypothetical protein